MNKKYPLYWLLGLFVVLSTVSCNKDDEEEDDSYYVSNTSSSVAVSAFNLKSNSKVLANLDSVFFTIDLKEGVIFNADSLPKGTDVSKVPASITYASTVSSAKIKVTNGTVMKDTIFDYTETDSIDFTGNVQLVLVSEDKLVTRNYTLKVNVHQLESDSLYWAKASRRDLPCGFAPEAARTVAMGNKVLSYAKGNGGYTLCTTDNPAKDNWTKQSVSFPFTPDFRNMAASDEAVYVLDDSGVLYESADGVNWTSCNVVWHSILGCFKDKYQNNVLGVLKSGDTYYHDQYPHNTNAVAYPVEDGFPVEQSSNMVVANTKWSQESQGLIVGGVNAAGETVASSWAFDGHEWAMLKEKAIAPRANVALVHYYTFATNTSTWTYTQNDVWLAMGGNDGKGDATSEIYVSYNQGIDWSVPTELLLLPDYIAPFTGAQAIVWNDTLTRSSSEWLSVPTRQLPVWYRREAPLTRAATPIDSWECPYVYLFGGSDSNGNVYNNVWRGVLNRLTFAPVY